MDTILQKYLDDRISLDDKYTRDELLALSMMDYLPPSELRSLILKNYNDDEKIITNLTREAKLKQFGFYNYPLSLHGIIKDKNGVSRYVFKTNDWVLTPIYKCMYHDLYYSETDGKYCTYFTENYYKFDLGDYVLQFSQKQDYYEIFEVVFDGNKGGITFDKESIWSMSILTTYKFDNISDAKKAMVLAKNSISLNKIYTQNLYIKPEYI